MFSKTSDYDATERLVKQTKESLMKMKPRNDSYKFTSCNVVYNIYQSLPIQLPIQLFNDSEVEIMFDSTDMTMGNLMPHDYPIGYLNDSKAAMMLPIAFGESKLNITIDQSYLDEPWDDDFLDKAMKKTVLNAFEMYIYIY